jgi:hypothetical protein
MLTFTHHLKKAVPNLVRIETSHEPLVNERILLWRYNRIIEEGYSFPLHDFYSYCALIIRHYGKEKMPKSFIDTEEIKQKVRFELINLQIRNDEEVSIEDFQFHLTERRKMVFERKKIIKNEIARSNIKGKILNKIGHSNSEFYRTLLKLTREFTDITLMDWFIPIVLTYERLIHIFIKHVEETKFGDGQFKQRSFFDYEPEEIWRLLKTIIKFEQIYIQEHFLENSLYHQLDRKELMKDYRRNYRNPIIFNQDEFILRIDKYGFIKQFYQQEKMIE